MGWSVSGAGDVNGDGYADVIVGAHCYDAGETNEGAAFVFLGGASGITGTDPSNAHATLQSNQADAYMGVQRLGGGRRQRRRLRRRDRRRTLPTTRARRTRGPPSSSWAAPSGITGTDPSNAHATLQSNQAERADGLERLGGGRRQRRRLRRRDRRRALLRRGRDGRGGRLRLPRQRLRHHRHRPDQRPRHAPVQPGQTLHGLRASRGRATSTATATPT